VATITLNRPAKLNAWTRDMAAEVKAAFDTAESDDRVRAIVLTGAGRGFCAGADMSLLTSVVEGSLPESDRPPSARAPIPLSEKPVIAAVNGPAVGLGFALTLFCDIRLAAASAQFGTGFAKRGLVAEFGLAWMLPRICGLGNALDLLLTARLIDAGEAKQMGLASRVLPDEGFAEAAHVYAADLANNVSPRSTRIMKRQVFAGLTHSLDEAFRLSEHEVAASLKCDDFREGVAHFLEKRPPSFTGR
jgi:enoyl-CoA hydratase/carnithine racemase